MYGHEITVPSVINRVLTSGPVEMELLYMLAPDKMAGMSMAYSGASPLVPEEYLNLPVMGGWFGTQTGNYEGIHCRRTGHNIV
jgi:iron complex transport system substrate-binding protein